MRVVEIFGSIDGEGKRTGKLATFIRLAGCNLRCCYCDTKYSFNPADAKEMSIGEILQECKNIGYHNVTLTGGEPLIHKESLGLVIALCECGFQVNIETNGTVDLSDYIRQRNIRNLDLFFTVDFKTKFSGERGRMNPHSFDNLDVNKDLVKCVVANREDMEDALEYLGSFDTKFNIWFSPVFGEIEPKKIVDYVKEVNRQDITVQVQLHKIIWNPEERGV